MDLQPAYLLHRRAYRESSLLLEVFTQDDGRVGLVAKGARGRKSSNKSLLQPFHPLLISSRGRGELTTLTSVELQSRGCHLSGNRLVCGFYANELLMRLMVRNDPHPQLFSSYRDLILDLESLEDFDVSLRYFEKNLLDELGYGLNLDHDVQTGEGIKAKSLYRYVVEEGPVEILEKGAKSITVSGETLINLKNQNLTTESNCSEAKYLLRMVLSHYLGSVPLRSRELLIHKNK